MYPSIPQFVPQLDKEDTITFGRFIYLEPVATCFSQASNPDFLQYHSPQPTLHDPVLFHYSVPHRRHLFCRAIQFIHVLLC